MATDGRVPDVVFEIGGDAPADAAPPPAPARMRRRWWIAAVIGAALVVGSLAAPGPRRPGPLLYLPRGEAVPLLRVDRRADGTPPYPWAARFGRWWTTVGGEPVAISVQWRDASDPSYARPVGAAGAGAGPTVQPVPVGADATGATWVDADGVRTVGIVGPARSALARGRLDASALAAIVDAVRRTPEPAPPPGFRRRTPTLATGDAAVTVEGGSALEPFSYAVFRADYDVAAARRESLDLEPGNEPYEARVGRHRALAGEGYLVWSPAPAVTIVLQQAGAPAERLLSLAAELAPADEATFARRLRTAGLDPVPTTWAPVGGDVRADGSSWQLVELQRGGAPCAVLTAFATDGAERSAELCGSDGSVAAGDVAVSVLPYAAVPAGGMLVRSVSGRAYLVRPYDPSRA